MKKTVFLTTLAAAVCWFTVFSCTPPAAKSSDADLSALAVSAGTLDPEFDSQRADYTVDVGNSTVSLSVTPTANDVSCRRIESRINNGGWTIVPSGSASGNMDLNPGANGIDVMVTAEDGITRKTYTLTVTRQGPGNADLSGLVLSAGTLSPAFESGTTEYDADVAHTAASLTVTPAAADVNHHKIEVRINDGPWATVVSGSASGSLPLKPGSNTAEVKVTAQDLITEKIYTVTVMRDRALWARSVTAGDSNSAFADTAVDGSGNAYAVGYISGTGTHAFGPGVAAAGTYAAHNAVIVKYDSAGSALWAKSVTAGIDSSDFNGVAVDPSGNVYAAGTITRTGTYEFGPGVTAGGTAEAHNYVLVKYAPDGTALWARTVTGESSGSDFFRVAAGISGDVYAVGRIFGTMPYDFGGGVTAAASFSNDNCVIVKYAADGTAQWAKTVTAAENVTSFFDVAIDPSGNVFAAGRIHGGETFTFEPGIEVGGANGVFNAMIVKFNAAGAAEWARSVTSGASYSSFLGLAADSAGNVYAAGEIAGTGTFEFGAGAAAAGISSNNMVLVKYDADGAAQWARSVTGGSGMSSLYDADVDASGGVFAAGMIRYSDVYEFGAGVTVTGAPGSSASVLLIKYGADGTAQWAKSTAAGSPTSFFSRLAAAGSGSIYAAGAVNGTETYAFGVDVTAGGTFTIANALLVKYDGQ